MQARASNTRERRQAQGRRVRAHPNNRLTFVCTLQTVDSSSKLRIQTNNRASESSRLLTMAQRSAAAATQARHREEEGMEYVPAEPLDESDRPPAASSGVLHFMRRSRSDSAAPESHALFRMDSDEEAASASSSSNAAATTVAAASAAASALPRIPRRGSVEAEMQLPLPDEDELLDGTVPLEIGRADSPEVDEEEEGEGGVELESALLNRAAAAAAAAAAPPCASAYRSAAARPSGGLSVGDFELLSVIGRGAYGKVFLVRKNDASGRLYAMKVVAKSEAIRKNVVANMLAEKNVLEAVRHPFIVNLRYAFQTESKLYLVLDYIGGGELFARLNASKDHSLSIKDAKFYCAEIVLAIEHLHKLDIVYRDLKPENCLLTRDGHICLTDFGFAKEAIAEAGSGTKSFCGTLHYMSPEMIEYAGHGKGSDWWALGCLLHEMLTGSTPFGGSNRKAILDNILSAPLKLPRWMDNPTKSILTELLRRPINKRLGCGPDGAAAIKKHVFFAGIHWNELAAKKVPPPFVPPMADAGDTSNFDAKFTRERAVDTPVSPQQMANVLAGHGITPSAFLSADATFANFSYKRDHTPAASPMLRGVDAVALMRRQNSSGSNSGGGGASGPIGSPRPLTGLPPPHQGANSHAHHQPPESLELPAAVAAAKPAAASSVAPAASAAAAIDSVDAPWPTADPAVLQKREQEASAKAAQRKAAKQAAAASAIPAAAPTTVAAAAAPAATPISPPRVKKPKPVKGNPSPPAPIQTNSAGAPGAATAANSSPSPPAAASSPNSARAPTGGASSQLSKQLAARQQQNNKQPAPQQQQQQTPAAAGPVVAAAVPPPAARPVGRGWESKGGASAAAAATSAVVVSAPPVPANAAAPSPAVASIGLTVAAAAPAPALGIRVLSSIKSLAPLSSTAANAASTSLAPLLPSNSAASSASSSGAAAPPAALSSPLRLSAAAKVFVPGQWGAPVAPKHAAAAAAAPILVAPVQPINSAAAAAPRAAVIVAPPPVAVPTGSAAPPKVAPVVAPTLSAASVTRVGAPSASSSAPTPVAATAPSASSAASSNPLGPARWGMTASAPAPIPQPKKS